MNNHQRADLVIENIKTLLTLAGPNHPRVKEEMNHISRIKNGCVAIQADKIIYAGPSPLPSFIKTDEQTHFINGENKTVTPGLIDPHTHLVHGGSREQELALKLHGTSYLEILAQGGGIFKTVKDTQRASFEQLYQQAKKSLDHMLAFGITTIEAKSGYGLDDFETELRQLEVAQKLHEDHPVDLVSTFMGAHAIPKAYQENPQAFIDFLIEKMIPEVKRRNLAEFIDVFVEQGVFSIDQGREILRAGEKFGLIPKIHADEIVPLGGAQLAAELNCISAEHLIATDDEGIKALAQAGVIAVLLPATSFNLQVEHFARGRAMIEAGVPVALATDYNPGSSPTENLQLVMTLACLVMKLTPEEVLTAVTINAAAAINRQDDIGSLEVGKKADIVLFDTPNLEYLIYHFGINHTDTVIKNGQIVYQKTS